MTPKCRSSFQWPAASNVSRFWLHISFQARSSVPWHEEDFRQSLGTCTQVGTDSSVLRCVHLTSPAYLDSIDFFYWVDVAKRSFSSWLVSPKTSFIHDPASVCWCVYFGWYCGRRQVLTLHARVSSCRSQWVYAGLIMLWSYKVYFSSAVQSFVCCGSMI